MADSVVRRFESLADISNTDGLILFQQTTAWNSQCPRAIPKAHVSDRQRNGRMRMPDRRRVDIWEEHDRRLTAVLERLKEKEVALNPQKCEFGKQSFKFLGHILDDNGVRPDPDKMSAIRQTHPPRNISELRRFLGMVNQVGKFSPNLAGIIRELLKKKQSWMWNETQSMAFTEIKEELP